MTAITAALVKELRDKTGAGMMDCKNALAATSGDMEAAIDWLRAKGLAKAAKKADRVAAEGLVGVATDGHRGAIVEINSETDFVARNAIFQELVAEVSRLALQDGEDASTLAKAAYPSSELDVAGQVQALVASIGEHISLRRAANLQVEHGVVAGYVHATVTPGLGRIGVLVGLESAGDAEKLLQLGRQLAMHIAATNPLSLAETDLDPALIDRERAVFSEQARQSGKPEAIIEKMVQGRVAKYLEEVVLLAQTFVIDGENKVAQVIAAAEKDVGAPIRLVGFVRFGLGEGLEKRQEDFATEVAAAAAGG